jgi:hypothetical protein
MVDTARESRLQSLQIQVDARDQLRSDISDMMNQLHTIDSLVGVGIELGSAGPPLTVRASPSAKMQNLKVLKLGGIGHPEATPGCVSLACPNTLTEATIYLVGPYVQAVSRPVFGVDVWHKLVHLTVNIYEDPDLEREILWSHLPALLSLTIFPKESDAISYDRLLPVLPASLTTLVLKNMIEQEVRLICSTVQRRGQVGPCLGRLVLEVSPWLADGIHDLTEIQEEQLLQLVGGALRILKDNSVEVEPADLVEQLHLAIE